MPFNYPDIFNAAPIDPWKSPSQPIAPYRPSFADDEDIKQAYGIALAKLPDAFKAGMEVFNQELPKALWASLNWVNDPVVVASKDIYLLTLKKAQKPLTKEELLDKILEFADEKIITKDGHAVPLVEAKERLNALKLYSEVSGFTGKIDINASTNNFDNSTVNNNFMKITLVKAERKEDAPKVIEHSNTKSKIQNEEVPIQLKLVGGTTR